MSERLFAIPRSNSQNVHAGVRQGWWACGVVLWFTARTRTVKCNSGRDGCGAATVPGPSRKLHLEGSSTLQAPGGVLQCGAWTCVCRGACASGRRAIACVLTVPPLIPLRCPLQLYPHNKTGGVDLKAIAAEAGACKHFCPSKWAKVGGMLQVSVTPLLPLGRSLA